MDGDKFSLETDAATWSTTCGQQWPIGVRTEHAGRCEAAVGEVLTLAKDGLERSGDICAVAMMKITWAVIQSDTALIWPLQLLSRYCDNKAESQQWRWRSVITRGRGEERTDEEPNQEAKPIRASRQVEDKAPVFIVVTGWTLFRGSVSMVGEDGSLVRRWMIRFCSNSRSETDESEKMSTGEAERTSDGGEEGKVGRW